MNQQGFDALSDDLSLVNDIFEKKIDEYTERYPNIRHPSRRAMREKFVKCPVLHSAYINQAARLAKLQSTSASRAGGITVINHIRDALIDSGEVYRSEMKPSRRAPQIGLLVDRDELHPESILLPRWRHQKTYLRVVAAELEAMGLILYELCGCFKTGMERRVSIENLRNEHKLSKNILEKYPMEAELILLMTRLKPSERPSANEILNSEKFKDWKKRFSD